MSISVRIAGRTVLGVTVYRGMPGSGGGTVTELAAEPADVFSVQNPTTTPVLSLDKQAKNTVLAGPVSGSDDVPGFRALTPGDLPGMTSAELSALLSDETGSGALVFGTSPTIATPAISTPTISSGAKFFNGDASFLTITTDANQTVDKTLTIVCNGDRTLTIGATSSISGTAYVAGGTDVAVADGGTGLSSGTSGGVLYFSDAGTIASSSAIASGSLVVGGGMGGALSGTTTGTGVLSMLGMAADGTVSSGIGFRGTPVNTQNNNYTIDVTDNGRLVLHAANEGPADDTYTFLEGMPVGMTVTVASLTPTLFITFGGGSAYIHGLGSVFTFNLEAYGVVVVTKVSATEWVVYGNGITI